MSFGRHEEIYPSDGGSTRAGSAPAHRLDEFPAGYSLAGCSPAEPASASPVSLILLRLLPFANAVSANGNLSPISVSHPRGAAHYATPKLRREPVPDFAALRSQIAGRRTNPGNSVLSGRALSRFPKASRKFLTKVKGFLYTWPDLVVSENKGALVQKSGSLMNIRMAVVCLCAVSVAAFAQSDRGTITGTISDPAGAVIANAMVEARNVDTGTVYQGGSSGTGNYTLAQMPTGTYELTVVVPGFKKFLRPGIIVPVAQVVRVDAVLEVGASTESVTVEAAAPLLKTESGELSTNVSTDTLNALPIFGIGNSASSASG